MRLIWVKVGGLWPVNTGGRIRSFHMLRELSRRHHVTLLTTHAPSEDTGALEAALPQCEVVSVPWALAKRGSARFALALVGSWLSSLPVDLYKARVPALGRELARRLEGGGVDLVVADFLLAAPNVTRAVTPPTVLFAHNVEHVIWQRMREVERRAWRRALLALESRKMRRYEALACARARLTIAVSDADRRLLAAVAPSARVSAVPTGVDVDYFAPDGVAEVPGRLVFTGSMDWYPNEDGIVHFIEAVLPRVRREVPGATLTVVGRNPSPRLRAAADAAGVHVTGLVDDRGGRLRRAAQDRRRDPAQDLRGACDGQGSRLDGDRRRGTPADAGSGFSASRRSRRVRPGRDVAPTGSGPASRGRERRPPPRRGAVLLAEGRRRIRKPMRGGASPCELACSVSGTWGA